MDLIISSINTIHTNNLITVVTVNPKTTSTVIRATKIQTIVAEEVISEEAIKDTQEEEDKITMVEVAIRTITEADMINEVEEEITIIIVVIITRDEEANAEIFN